MAHLKSHVHKLLWSSDIHSAMLKGLRASSIQEMPIPVSINRKAIGNFQALEIFEKVEGTHAFPQTVADIISNSYIRLSHQKSDGTSATFGTSVVGSPSYRTVDGVLNFIPRITEAAVDIPTTFYPLKICLDGMYGDTARVTSVRTYATKSRIDHVSMILEVGFTAVKDIAIYRSSIGTDSFRLLSISSMYAGTTCYDGNIVRVKTCGETKNLTLHTATKRGGYLLYANQAVSEFAVVKDTGSTGAPRTPGSFDSPSVHVRILESSLPLTELGVQAYLDDSILIDDDSLSVWLEWRGCPAVIPKGFHLSIKTEITALPPEPIKKSDSEPQEK